MKLKKQATSSLLTLLLASSAFATPSQSDVFKSIQNNVSQSDTSGSTDITPWICAGAGVILVLVLFAKRQTRQNSTKLVNNSGRLLKEVMKAIPLKSGELKQLKTVSEEIQPVASPAPVNPLVLLLCPSIVVKSLNDRTTKADRKTLVGVMKKLGIR